MPPKAPAPGAKKAVVAKTTATTITASTTSSSSGVLTAARSHSLLEESVRQGSRVGFRENKGTTSTISQTHASPPPRSQDHLSTGLLAEIPAVSHSPYGSHNYHQSNTTSMETQVRLGFGWSNASQTRSSHRRFKVKDRKFTIHCSENSKRGKEILFLSPFPPSTYAHTHTHTLSLSMKPNTFEWDSARICADLTVCKDNEFELRAPGPNCDRVCHPLTVCRSDEYESAAPTATTDRQCVLLTVCHPRKEYESKAPTATSDRQCSPVSACDNDSFQVIKAGRYNNRVCCGRRFVKLRRLVRAIFRMVRRNAQKNDRSFVLQQQEETATDVSNAELVASIQALLKLSPDSKVQFVPTSATTVNAESGEIEVSLQMFGPTEEVDAALAAAQSAEAQELAAGTNKKDSFTYVDQPLVEEPEAPSSTTVSVTDAKEDGAGAAAGLKSASAGTHTESQESYYKSLLMGSVALIIILSILIVVLLAVLFRRRKNEDVAAKLAAKTLEDKVNEKVFARQRRGTLDFSSDEDVTDLTGSGVSEVKTVTNSVKVEDLDASGVAASPDFSLSTSSNYDEEAVMVQRGDGRPRGENPLSPLPEDF